METYYMERANGQDKYWTYSDGETVYVNKQFVQKEVHKKNARLVKVQ